MGPCPLGLLSPLNHQFLVVQPVLSMEIKFPIRGLRSAARVHPYKWTRVYFHAVAIGRSTMDGMDGPGALRFLTWEPVRAFSSWLPRVPQTFENSRTL